MIMITRQLATATVGVSVRALIRIVILVTISLAPTVIYASPSATCIEPSGAQTWISCSAPQPVARCFSWWQYGQQRCSCACFRSVQEYSACQDECTRQEVQTGESYGPCMISCDLEYIPDVN